MQRILNQMLGTNPLFQRAQQMASGKNGEEINQIARNLCKQRGIDFNEAYKAFQRQMGMPTNNVINH